VANGPRDLGSKPRTLSQEKFVTLPVTSCPLRPKSDPMNTHTRNDAKGQKRKLGHV
jgi:hypothetical protein